MESNFEFIKDTFPETYRHLAEAERNVRISQVIDVRKALESLVKERVGLANAGWLFSKYARINNIKAPNISLDNQLSICLSKELLGQLGWEDDVPLLPDIAGTTQCELLNGKMKGLSAYKFLRRYGNSSSHIEGKKNLDVFIKIDYDISIKALAVFHRIFVKIIKNLKKEVPAFQDFNEEMMPIRGQEHLYYIDEAGVPTDAPMSKCQIEFNAHFKRSGSRAGVQYALIRQYDKKDVDTTFLLRNVDTVQKTQDELIDALPPCMVRPVEISTIENQGSPFYIVAYHFQEKPHALSNELLQSLDMKSRLSICMELAQCMAELHQMGIYHRLLSHASVYVCDYRSRGKGWKPHLVKFDFAKLEQNQMGTVLPWVQEAKNNLEDESIKKYISLNDWKYDRWEKADIYSLGILFCDILSGRINKNRAQMEEAMGKVFASRQLSDTVADFLERIIDDVAESRPSAAEIQRVMETEMSKWN